MQRGAYGFSIIIILAFTTLDAAYCQAQSCREARADRACERQDYTRAIEIYNKVDRDVDAHRIISKLANCYRITGQHNEAERLLSKVCQSNEAQPQHYLQYAQVLQINEHYSEAANWYTKFKDMGPGDVRSQKQIEACRNTKQFYQVDDLQKSKSYKIDLTDFNAYKFNSESRIHHECHTTIDPDNSRVYFTRKSNNKIRKRQGLDRSGGLKLYEADVHENRWTKITAFEYNNDAYNIGYASINPDSKCLYFISDMPGGYGGMDVYVSVWSDSQWGRPVNLGPSINTEGDEMFPVIRDNGMLYFASDGHGGLGGLDMFCATVKDSGWINISNMGAPLNSSKDDFGIVFQAEIDEGHITSNREGRNNTYRFYREDNNEKGASSITY